MSGNTRFGPRALKCVESLVSHTQDLGSFTLLSGPQSSHLYSGDGVSKEICTLPTAASSGLAYEDSSNHPPPSPKPGPVPGSHPKSPASSGFLQLNSVLLLHYSMPAVSQHDQNSQLPQTCPPPSLPQTAPTIPTQTPTQEPGGHPGSPIAFTTTPLHPFFMGFSPLYPKGPNLLPSAPYLPHLPTVLSIRAQLETWRLSVAGPAPPPFLPCHSAPGQGGAWDSLDASPSPLAPGPLLMLFPCLGGLCPLWALW